MIILSVFVFLISFLFQGLISNIHNYTIIHLSIFSAIYLLLALVVLQPYFENDKKFIIMLLVFGILFDITYTNTFVLSTCIFIIIFYLNKFLNFIFPYNLFTVNMFALISMIVYHIITFIFLTVFKFDSYGFLTLLKIIMSNIIMTITYTTIVYYIVIFISKKFNLKVVKD